MIDIDKLEAGPELDALIAEKVFGWTNMTKSGDGDPIGNPPGDSRWCGPGEYSTDIAAAWTIIEKLRNDGFHFMISIPKLSRDPSVYLGIVEDQVHEGKARAQSLPLAICRAALKVV